MLSRQNRLKKDADFSRVFKEGRRSRVGALTFIVAANGLDLPRFGVVVSKKISKKAVVRNHLRRVIAAILSEQKDNLALQSKDVVVVVGALPQEPPSFYQQLKEQIEQWLK